MHPTQMPSPVLLAQEAPLGFTVFAALGHLGVPNAADRFTVSFREVLFAM
jgi:hypothetical protein